MMGTEAAPTADFKFSAAALSDPGMVRTLNEDSFIVRSDVGLWAVADGVGGHDAGDVASRMLAEALAGLEIPLGGKAFLDAVRTTIESANARMIAATQDSKHARGMASTIACLIAYRDHIACLWAGDSRIYRLREGRLTQLTRDHSLVQDMLDKGEITAEQARGHVRGNVITRAVGARAHLEVDIVREPIRSSDRYVICSDGLTGVLTDEEIASETGGQSLDVAAHRLMDRVLARGARDNVTFILVEATENLEDKTIRRTPGDPA